MDIIFYKLQDEANDVKKTRTLTATQTYTPKIIQGYLRGSTSKITPSIEFACDIIQFNDWNYCYIADFKRYYFVMDVISVRAGVTAVDLKVDVLTSFFTPANQTKIQGYVGRCANSTLYNDFIPDKLVQFKNDKTVDVSIPTNITGNIVNTNFSTTATDNVLISTTVFTDNAFTVDPPIQDITIPSDLYFLTKFTSSFNKNYFRPKGNYYLYTCSLSDTQLVPSSSPAYYVNKVACFLNVMAYQSDAETFVNNVIVYPFSLPNDNTLTDVKAKDKAVSLGGGSLAVGNSLQMKSVTQTNSGFLIIKDFTLQRTSDPSNFTRYEPYTTCDIHIPFVGWRNIDIKSTYGHRLVVAYNVDYTTGNATAMLIDVTKGNVIFQSSVQIGVQVPVNTSNAKENDLKDRNYVTSYATGFTVSAISTIAGIASTNPFLVAGGITGLASATTQYINNENLLLDRAQAQTVPANASVGMFSGLDVLVKWSYLTSINYDSSTQKEIFKKQLGIPTNKICKIEDIPVTGDYHTYAEIVDLHITSEDGLYSLQDITSPEIDELKRLCASGIYL